MGALFTTMSGEDTNDVAAAPDGPRDRVGWRVRLGFFLVVGVLVWAALTPTEWWPLTGWRLYSNRKGPTSGSYFAYRVAPDGSEHEIDYQRIPDAYRRAPYLLEKFPRLGGAGREEICAALAHAERGEGRAVTAIHVYWDRYQVLIRDGERSTKQLEHDLRYTCAETEDDP
jgi:hypothetical protein